jgi:kynureninase
MTKLTRAELAQRDASDPLAAFRKDFVLPEGVFYFAGNSLGALPHSAATRVGEVVAQEWGQDLVRSWNEHGWIDMPLRIGAKLAPLIGARANEVAAADSTSVNLFKLLASALKLRPGRKVILTEEFNFPTDHYIMQGLTRLLDDGYEVRTTPAEQIIEAIDDTVAVVTLTEVDYRTARMHDMAAVTRAAHRHGTLTLWDLSHSAGVVPTDLNGCEADLAIGCGYKYLSGGPGAPAFLFVAQRLQNEIEPPLAGWMGHAAPFEFSTDYRPAAGITRNLCGTPPILSMAALEAAIDVIAKAGIGAIRRKSVAMMEAFIALIEQECAGLDLEIVTPRDADLRGSHVALRHADGYPVMRALIARGVVGDFRAPDLMRFGITPLSLRYTDLWDAVAILREVVADRTWDTPEYRTRAAVT